MGKNKGKNREKEIKWLEKRIKSKALRKKPELRELLEEIRVCYVAGANRAVHLLVIHFVERYLNVVFFKDATDVQELLAFSEEQQLQHVATRPVADGQVLRQKRSTALQALDNSLAFLEAGKKVAIKDLSSKEIRKVLQQVDNLLVSMQ